MPVALTYPGVYVEEISSGVRTITGVATSIAAFVGRAARGPVDADADGPVTINSFGDFERYFGGLDPAYPMSYAVRDFYINGGSKAVIVRIYAATAHKPAKATIKLGDNLVLEAASSGTTGNMLRARVDDKVSAEVAASYGLTAADLFNLTLRVMPDGPQETFVNLTMKESPRRIDRVLAAGSMLARVNAPPAAKIPTTGVPPKSGEAKPNKSVWDDDTSSTGVIDEAKALDSAPLSSAAYLGSEVGKTGIFALKKVDLFNLLCIPPDTRDGNTDLSVYQAALTFCVARRAMLLVDPPTTWTSANAITANNNKALTDLNLNGPAARNAAIYFPRLIEADPKRQGQPDTFVPCGAVAGVMARTDVQRGVWKAPAGIDSSVNGLQALAVPLTDDENGMLNPLGVNCLRSFPLIGPVVWGSRTLRGADLLADEYKYVPVRRLALYIEESLFRGTQWVVFEPNDEPLWAQIRLNVGAFMHDLFRQGAFQGTTPKDAYFVKCDKETTIQNDIDHGIVNIVVGFAPLKPAEFVVIQLQQIAGQIQT